MAQDFKDLFNISVQLTANISLDWERIREDPVYKTCLMINPDAPLEAYLEYYVTKSVFLKDMPSTNGPGYFTSIKLIEGKENAT